MKFINSVLLASCLLIFCNCAKEEKAKYIQVKNSLSTERAFETVELTKEFLKVEDLSTVGIRDKDSESGELEVTQLVDSDSDGVFDQLLFQPKLDANSEKQYEIVQIESSQEQISLAVCYSRFVPERTDDYTWENDRVAFRAFGPTAQKMVEDNVAGGTLTSGIDAWLKKVEYPIINKWYEKDLSKKGSYHEDTGEGLDNFHVGVSRGVGGLASKVDDSYYFSKNFTEWETITIGPIRTSFYLNYDAWDADGNKIEESKIVSLDLGSNLTKYSVTLVGVSEISAGLTLHEKDGVVTGNKEKGWVSYWQPHGDSELGTAIVASPGSFIGFEKYDVEEKDKSNAFAHLNITDNSIVYYAGFGWKESGQFKSKQEWESYLNDFSDKLESPLTVSLVE